VLNNQTALIRESIGDRLVLELQASQEIQKERNHFVLDINVLVQNPELHDIRLAKIGNVNKFIKQQHLNSKYIYTLNHMSNNTYSLLVEEPVYEVKYLIEEKNRNTPSILHIEGDFLMANRANKNKRIYPLEEMVKEVNRYQEEMIKTNRATGELNHPSSPEVNLERICHMVTDLRQEGDIFKGKSRVLSTPMGQIVRSLIMDGVRLGVSSRAMGVTTPDGNGVSRVSDFRLVAVDVVADPSVPSAFVNGILESKQWVLNENGQFTPVYENFEKSISNLPKKNVDDYLKEQIISFINSLKTL